MAIIKPSTPFDAIKRKFAKSDEIHFRNRKADNATISVHDLLSISARLKTVFQLYVS